VLIRWACPTTCCALELCHCAHNLSRRGLSIAAPTPTSIPAGEGLFDRFSGSWTGFLLSGSLIFSSQENKLGKEIDVQNLKKALRIAFWTLCCLSFTLVCYLLIQGPRGVSGALDEVASIDPFLVVLGFFVSLVSAFIADICYVARYG
jgi:hypothetical protein